MFLRKVWLLFLGPCSLLQGFRCFPAAFAESRSFLMQHPVEASHHCGLLIKTVKGRRRPQQLALAKRRHRLVSILSCIDLTGIFCTHSHAQLWSEEAAGMKPASLRVLVFLSFSLRVQERLRFITPLLRASKPSPIVAWREL